MNRHYSYDKHINYIETNELNKVINFQEISENHENAPFPPDVDDLVRLHKIIRKRKCRTILEFGVGHSTIIIADALKKNNEDWDKLPDRPLVRNRFMFQLFSVDASEKWIEYTEKQLPNYLVQRVHFHYSTVQVGNLNGQLCHYYVNLPDIVPDFIYLDGPDPKDVNGNINGLSFKCDERTVMAADILLMESTLLPGTLILVDGRTNNARFLEMNLLRNFRIGCDKEGDVTSFELVEEPLGKLNLFG